MQLFLSSVLCSYLFLFPQTIQSIDISTCSDLQNIKNDLQNDYNLVNDIDCSGTVFNIIGESADRPFVGVLHGGGFTIRSVTIQASAEGIGSLFGYTRNAFLENFNLENIFVEGDLEVAASLISLANSTTISRVTLWSGLITTTATRPVVFGGLIGSGNRVSIIESISMIDFDTCGESTGGGVLGVLVGSISNQSTIQHSHATGSISCFVSTASFTTKCGALVGTLSSTDTVLDSYSQGNVICSIAGGLIGETGTQSTNRITRCHAAGNVTSYRIGGGLIGNADAFVRDSYASGYVIGVGSGISGGLIGLGGYLNLVNCYSSGGVSGTGRFGGLVGSINGNSNITSSYWDIEKSNQTSSAAGEAKTTSEMYLRKTYDGWNFLLIWNIQEEKSYPWLRRVDEIFVQKSVDISVPSRTDCPGVL